MALTDIKDWHEEPRKIKSPLVMGPAGARPDQISHAIRGVMSAVFRHFDQVNASDGGLLVYDGAAGRFSMKSATGAGLVTEAPAGGNAYGRSSGAWVKVPKEAPYDGVSYGRRSGAWAEVIDTLGGQSIAGSLDAASLSESGVSISSKYLASHSALWHTIGNGASAPVWAAVCDIDVTGNYEGAFVDVDVMNRYVSGSFRVWVQTGPTATSNGGVEIITADPRRSVTRAADGVVVTVDRSGTTTKATVWVLLEAWSQNCYARARAAGTSQSRNPITKWYSKNELISATKPSGVSQTVSSTRSHDLFYASSKRLSTTSNGISVVGGAYSVDANNATNWSLTVGGGGNLDIRNHKAGASVSFGVSNSSGAAVWQGYVNSSGWVLRHGGKDRLLTSPSGVTVRSDNTDIVAGVASLVIAGGDGVKWARLGVLNATDKNLYLKNDTPGGLTLIAGSSSSGAYRNQILLNPNGSVSIAYNGIYKLWTTSAGISVSGTGTASDWIATSDARLKSNIREIETGVADAALKNINAYTYMKKGHRSMQAGLIAQEVMSVSPEAVAKSGDGMLSISQSAMNAIMWATIKRLNEKIEWLSQQVAP